MGPRFSSPYRPNHGSVGCYRTGFRASELACQTPERFDLASNPPTATVPAAYTKNGREAVQPLPPVLAARLSPWLTSLPAGRPIFAMPDRTAEMIRADLAAAGIDYETPAGVADFHSLRGVYISELVASGASVKVYQTLARHSTPSLTIGLYAKASLHDIKGAVAALPDPGHEAPTSEALAATGTNSGSALTAQGQRAGDGMGRDMSVIFTIDYANTASHSNATMAHNPHDSSDLDGSCRSESGPVVNAGGGSRTHMGVTPRRILSPRRLPFRHAGPEATTSWSAQGQSSSAAHVATARISAGRPWRPLPGSVARRRGSP